MTGSYLANDTPAQVTARGTPKRFELPDATGVLDQWPLVMMIERGRERHAMNASRIVSREQGRALDQAAGRWPQGQLPPALLSGCR